jgi:hypothetical protein
MHHILLLTAERAKDIEILAGLTSSDMRPISFLPGELGANKDIPIPTRTEGQYVTVRIKNPMAQTLHLCEVEVFGAQIRPGTKQWGHSIVSIRRTIEVSFKGILYAYEMSKRVKCEVRAP